MGRITWSIVRPVVTLMFAIALVYGFIVGKIQSETAVGVFSSAITWWFTSRDAAKAYEKSILPTTIPIDVIKKE